jgi:hypothetical protein
MLPFKKTLNSISKDLPIVKENWLSEEEIFQLKNEIDKIKNSYEAGLEGQTTHKYQPQIIKSMSRCFIEFDVPESIKEKTDLLAKMYFPDELRMAHVVYIEYDKKYGDGINPFLNPHFDMDNNIITIDYSLNNDMGWEINIEGQKFLSKTNSVLIFSAINQIHWRPKREFLDKEKCEIVTFNYVPVDDWKFTTGEDPLSPRFFPEKRKEVTDYLSELPDMKKYALMWDKGE